MSLILDALRKSEAERRRGQAPDLHAELPPAVQSARAGRPAWPWLLALAVTAMAVALAITWLARDQRAPAPEQLPAQVGESAPATSVAEAAAPPIEPARSPSRGEGVTSRADTPTVATTAPAEPASAPPPRPQAKPEPSTPPLRGTSDRRAVAIPAPAATSPAVQRPVASSTPPASSLPPAQPSAAATPTTPDATATAIDAPLQLADLAAAERRALPPLKISMHMWAPTSAGRFAIIDGARVNEGDRLGDAVVDEITRDGVILAWHGRRVQIPIH